MDEAVLPLGQVMAPTWSGVGSPLTSQRSPIQPGDGTAMEAPRSHHQPLGCHRLGEPKARPGPVHGSAAPGAPGRASTSSPGEQHDLGDGDLQSPAHTGLSSCSGPATIGTPLVGRSDGSWRVTTMHVRPPASTPMRPSSRHWLPFLPCSTNVMMGSDDPMTSGQQPGARVGSQQRRDLPARRIECRR